MQNDIHRLPNCNMRLWHIIQKAFNGNQHPRDDKGRFTDKGETRAAKIKRIASQTPLITDIKPLVPTSSNIRQALNQLRELSREGKLRCKCLDNRRVVVNSISITHHYLKAKNIKRIDKEIKTRGMLLPYVATILNKTGAVAEKDIKRKGSYGIVGRAMVGKDETAIKIVLQKDRTKDLLYLSVLNMGEIKKGMATTFTEYCKRNKSLKASLVTSLSPYLISSGVIKTTPTTYTIIDKKERKSSSLSYIFAIHDITEYNARQKLAAFNNALYLKATHNKSLVQANSNIRQNITKAWQPFWSYKKPIAQTQYIRIKELDRTHINKAVWSFAFSLGEPLKASDMGERFVFKSIEDLCNRWYVFFNNMLNTLYNNITKKFDLPQKNIIQKSQDLSWHGQVLYSPETGRPITMNEWEKFVKTLEKFLSSKTKGVAKKIVLDAKSLGVILDRMLKTNTLEAIQKQRLDSIRLDGKSFNDIAKKARASIAEQAIITGVGNRITSASDTMKNKVKQIILDGVTQKQSKSIISQKLFDNLVKANRDFARIADTETQNAVNSAYIASEVADAPIGAPVYFQRLEVVDGNTCPHCKAANGIIAKWDSKDNTLTTEGGEVLEMGAFHPWCRGVWVRYNSKDIKKSFNNTQHPRDSKGRFTDKGESRVARLKRIASQTPLITDIKPLVPTNSNIRQALNQLRELSREGKLRCKCLDNRRVVVNKASIQHFYYKKGYVARTSQEMQKRGALLSFVPTILNKTGIIAEEDINIKGSYGIVGRAMVNGNETVIKIVLVKRQNDLLYLSIINMEKNKSTVNCYNSKKITTAGMS